MRLVVNGEPLDLDVEAGATVVLLLDRISVRRDAVAVELNGVVVPRQRHADTVLHDGDRLEVVTFVGGG